MHHDARQSPHYFSKFDSQVSTYIWSYLQLLNQKQLSTIAMNASRKNRAATTITAQTFAERLLAPFVDRRTLLMKQILLQAALHVHMTATQRKLYSDYMRIAEQHAITNKPQYQRKYIRYRNRFWTGDTATGD